MLQGYPTPETLARAQYNDIQPYFAHLGLFRRADWLIKLAKAWLVDPPQPDKLKKKRGLESEVAHLPGVGTFASDAWRIFCKDDLYTRAGFQTKLFEWKKVLPTNEGLIAYLWDRWNGEGFDWDPSTGHSQKRGVRQLEEKTEVSTDTINLVTPISSIPS